MKSHVKLSLFTYFFLLFSGFNSWAGGYEIKVKVDGLKDSACYLAFYYGDNTYLKDTAQIDRRGVAVFEGNEPLPGGIYMFVYPRKDNYFEFIVNEQNFTLETQKKNPVLNMEVHGSKENEVFFDYLKFLASQRQKASRLQKKMEALDPNEEKAQAVRKKLNRINKAVNDKRESIKDNYPSLFYPKVLKAMEEPDIPDSLMNTKGKADSTWSFYYYKKHFFDNIDFSDDRLLRTPILHKRVKKYLNKLTPKNPDSIISSVDVILQKAKANNEMFKYFTIWLTSKYERDKIMGMDKVFVHLAQKYYLSDDAYWVDEKQHNKLAKEVRKIKPNLIGQTAPDLVMKDTSGEYHGLHDLDKKYTVLYFWDSQCGHCQKVTPKLKKLYDSLINEEVDLEVFAVNIETKQKTWKKYVRKHHLDWINVQDPYNRTNFRVNYNVFSTPVIYLLNKDKEIIAKRLTIKQLGDFLRRKIKQDKKQEAQKG